METLTHEFNHITDVWTRPQERGWWWGEARGKGVPRDGWGDGEQGMGKELTLVTVGNCALTGNCKAVDKRHSTKHCSHWKVCFSQRYR